MGLLASFRLTGILSGPIAIAETITLETVKWESERPYTNIDIKESIRGFYKNEIELLSEISVDDYHSSSLEYGGSGYIALVVNVTTHLQAGFVNSVSILLYEDYENSEINFFNVDTWPKFHAHVENLSIADYSHYQLGKGLKAFIKMTSVNRPKGAHFDGPLHWILRSPQDRSHSLEVAIEIVYYNGSAYSKVVQPFQLRIGPDDNNSFETAQEITEGYYPRFYIGARPDAGDFKDFFKIYVSQGQRIRVNVTGTDELLIEVPVIHLYLYDHERNLVAAKERFDYFQTLDVAAYSSGFWFIEVRLDGGHGFYSLTISQEP